MMARQCSVYMSGSSLSIHIIRMMHSGHAHIDKVQQIVVKRISTVVQATSRVKNDYYILAQTSV